MRAPMLLPLRPLLLVPWLLLLPMLLVPSLIVPLLAPLTLVCMLKPLLPLPLLL